MSNWPDVCYSYDGTFAGFLTCVHHSYLYRENPAAFSPPEDERISIYPQRQVDTCRQHALQVYRSLTAKISPAARQLASLGFLTCMPDRELIIYRFIRLGYSVGPGVTNWLTHERVAPLVKGVRHLTNEAHLLKGFVRFSDFDGLLAGEIQPKNRVLPLLRPHFCDRFSGETFLLYDRTHREALFYRPGQWAILPLADFRMAAPGQEEREFRQMWRKFYDTIAIEGRYNPKLRMTHMPKRYWSTMTEFQEDPPDQGPPRIK